MWLKWVLWVWWNNHSYFIVYLYLWWWDCGIEIIWIRLRECRVRLRRRHQWRSDRVRCKTLEGRWSISSTNSWRYRRCLLSRSISPSRSFSNQCPQTPISSIAPSKWDLSSSTPPNTPPENALPITIPSPGLSLPTSPSRLATYIINITPSLRSASASIFFNICFFW